MKKLGFFGKQLLLYSIILLVMVAFLISWAYSYVIEVSREKAIVNQEQLTTATMEKVDAYLDQLMLTASQVAHDSEVVETMELLYDAANDPAKNYFASDLEAQTRMAEILKLHSSLDEFVRYIDVRNAYGDYISSDPTPERLQAGVERYCNEGTQYHMDKNFVQEQREFLMMGPTGKSIMAGAVEASVVYMMMPIKSYDGSTIYGYLDVYRSVEPLFRQLEMDKETGMDVYLFFEVSRERGEQFYPTDKEFPDTSTGDYYETERRSQYWWYVVLLQNQTEFLASYRSLLVYLCTAGLALFGLLFVCVYLLIRYTSRPILELSQRVREANLENRQMPVSGPALDEVKELEQSVDQMLQRVKASTELEQQAYLKALQAQMRPHFLYNCLSTISSLGVEADAPAIPEFCSHLASILRYEASYKGRQVTLADEMENVRDFLELMKVRYEDDMSYVLEVEEGLEDLPLPRLVMQPMVENCFEHGFKAVEPPWQLSVKAFTEGSRWVICVSDNGVGFDETVRVRLMEQAEQLIGNLGESYDDLDIGGLGLVNTIVRLRLMSDRPVSFTVEPNVPSGTIITLRGERP